MLKLLPVLFSVMLALGQAGFKWTADAWQREGTLFTPKVMAILIGTLIFYGGATLVWMIVLKHWPLSMAYAFMALNFVIVPMIGYFMFGETLSLQFMLGTALIITGVIVVATSQ